MDHDDENRKKRVDLAQDPVLTSALGLLRAGAGAGSDPFFYDPYDAEGRSRSRPGTEGLPDAAAVHLPPMTLPPAVAHKTIEMASVRLAAEVDPRRHMTMPGIAPRAAAEGGFPAARPMGDTPGQLAVTTFVSSARVVPVPAAPSVASVREDEETAVALPVIPMRSRRVAAAIVMAAGAVLVGGLVLVASNGPVGRSGTSSPTVASGAVLVIATASSAEVPAVIEAGEERAAPPSVRDEPAVPAAAPVAAPEAVLAVGAKPGASARKRGPAPSSPASAPAIVAAPAVAAAPAAAPSAPAAAPLDSAPVLKPSPKF